MNCKYCHLPIQSVVIIEPMFYKHGDRDEYAHEICYWKNKSDEKACRLASIIDATNTRAREAGLPEGNEKTIKETIDLIADNAVLLKTERDKWRNECKALRKSVEESKL